MRKTQFASDEINKPEFEIIEEINLVYLENCSFPQRP
jgi:hypothetical protein